MPLIIKYWLLKLFGRPFAVILVSILFIAKSKDTIKDYIKPFVFEWVDELQLDLNHQDLVLIEILKNIDAEVIVESGMSWKIFKLWCKVFWQAITDKHCKDLIYADE